MWIFAYLLVTELGLLIVQHVHVLPEALVAANFLDYASCAVSGEGVSVVGQREVVENIFDLCCTHNSIIRRNFKHGVEQEAMTRPSTSTCTTSFYSDTYD